MKDSRAEVLAIGTEILLGEIVDTNTSAIARGLRSIGVNLYRTSTVGDNVDRIAAAVRESVERAEVVITSGGLGPTVDDVTRAGIATAIGTHTVFEPALWEQIQERFARFGTTPGENNRRQAYLPRGAKAIENPIGTAPAFSLEAAGKLIFALPGVPAELELLLEQSVLPQIKERFELEATIQSRLLRTAGVGESQLDSKIQDLERAANPTLGVAAHPGRVDLRLTARAGSEEEARELLDRGEAELRERLGDRIYGLDDETLEGVLLAGLADRGWQLATVEVGTHGALAAALANVGAAFRSGRVLPPSARAPLAEPLTQELDATGAEAGLALQLIEGEDELAMRALFHTPDGERNLEQTYRQPIANGPARALSYCLEMARRELLGLK